MFGFYFALFCIEFIDTLNLIPFHFYVHLNIISVFKLILFCFVLNLLLHSILIITNSICWFYIGLNIQISHDIDISSILVDNNLQNLEQCINIKQLNGEISSCIMCLIYIKMINGSSLIMNEYAIDKNNLKQIELKHGFLHWRNSFQVKKLIVAQSVS